MLTAVTGINWGDEGKGRVIDLLAENADVVARYQGGNNAGHTVVTEQGKFILNLLPSGILHPDVTCVLGTGMVIDLDHLAGEMQAIEARGVKIGPENLKLSDKATISMPWHKVQDGLEEDRLAKNGTAFGSTRRGIAYAYSDKYRKKTLRLGDLLHLDEERTQNRLRMVKNLAISADHIEITAAPRRDAAKELFQARIADIDQKDALRGRGSVCQFDRPGQRNDPSILIFRIVKHILYVRQGEMQVFRPV